MKTSLTEGKYITFKISNYILALPIDNIFKVITCPPDLSKILKHTKLAQMGKRTVMLLNLRASLDPHLNHQQDNDCFGRFLIITQGSQEELYGILVDAPPNLLKISETSIQSVPESFHHIGLPSWVSQIAILNHKDQPSTILMLDINQAFALK
ncbi:chemotaxis protein CheW [Iningainema tapete]|uniref:Chemotaxis protein CheW n=1 Tax=Iningainema tapete BLCC-T55 TaxID=2748662 RepID=A0A8J7C9F8_9CYAN|nr:chemotaxis protein CheW [Iningainema tapete]MBD2775891.1 chemotaxis protein CheW [Iningainema tapete BLCC-T55]